MDCCKPMGKGMRHHAQPGTGCCCDSGYHDHGFHRRFISKKERVEFLKEYAKDLEKEIEGVKEKIADLE